MESRPASLPGVNQRVNLLVSEWDARLETRVEDYDERRLVVALPSEEGQEVELPEGHSVEVEWVTPRGLARVLGKIAGDGGLRIPSVAIRLISQPEIFQRRDNVRVVAPLDIVVSRLEENAEPVWGVTVDLSGGGLRAKLPEAVELEVGLRVDVGIAVPDEENTVYGVARVIRREENGAHVLAYDRIAASDRERIVRFVFRRLRESLWIAA